MLDEGGGGGGGGGRAYMASLKVQLTLDNSNPRLLQPPANSKQFSFPFRASGHFLYNFTVDNSMFAKT